MSCSLLLLALLMFASSLVVDAACPPPGSIASNLSVTDCVSSDFRLSIDADNVTIIIENTRCVGVCRITSNRSGVRLRLLGCDFSDGTVAFSGSNTVAEVHNSTIVGSGDVVVHITRRRRRVNCIDNHPYRRRVDHGHRLDAQC